MSEWKTVRQPPKWYELLIARLILLDGRPGWPRTLFGSPLKRIGWGLVLGVFLGWLAVVLFGPAPVGEPVPADLVVRGKRAAYTLRAPGPQWRILNDSEEGSACDVHLLAREGEILVLVNPLPPGSGPNALREPLLDYFRQQYPDLTEIAEGPNTHLRLSEKDEALMRMVATPTTCYTVIFLTTRERFEPERAAMEKTLASFTSL